MWRAVPYKTNKARGFAPQALFVILHPCCYPIEGYS